MSIFAAMMTMHDDSIREVFKSLKRTVASFRDLSYNDSWGFRAPPQSEAYGLAHSLDEIGIKLSNAGNLWEAEVAFQDAIGLLREFEYGCRKAVEFHRPDTYEGFLASVLCRLGDVRHKRDRLAEAEAAYQEAVELYRATSRHKRDRLAEAEAAYQEAVELYRPLAATSTEFQGFLARILYRLGAVWHKRDRLAEAEAAYQEAVELYRATSTGLQDGLAISLGCLGYIRYQRGYLTEVEAIWREAVEAAPTNNSIPLKLLMCWLLENMERYAEAETILRNVLEQMRWLIAAQRKPQKVFQEIMQLHKQLPRVTVNLGRILAHQKHWAEAESVYQEAVELYRPLAATSIEYLGPLALVLCRLGDVWHKRDRLSEAKAAYQEAVGLYRTLVATPKLPNNEYKLELARALALSEARDGLSQDSIVEIAELTSFPEGSVSLEFIRARASALMFLGQKLETEGQWKVAELFYQEAIKMMGTLFQDREKNISIMDLKGMAAAYTGCGRVIEAQGRQERLYEAKELWTEAVRITSYHPSMLDGKTLRDSRRLTFWALGRVTPAQGFLPGNTRWSALWYLSRVARAEGNLTQAYRSLNIALREIEKKRGMMRLREDRIRFQQVYVPLYREIVDLCLELGRPDKAWHWVERAKGRTLLDLFGNVRPRLANSEMRHIYEEWQHLEQEISDLEMTLLSREHDELIRGDFTPFAMPNQSVAWEDRLIELRKQAAHRQRLLFQKLDEGRELLQVHVPPPKQLAASLRHLALGQAPENSATRRPLLVQYFLHGQDRYTIFFLPLWQVTSEQPLPILVHSYTLPDGTVEDVLSTFASALDSARKGEAGRYRAAVPTESHDRSESERNDLRQTFLAKFDLLMDKVGRAFVQPCQETIESLAPSDLLLVPHGFLYALPLHAASLNDGTPLIARYPVLYQGTATLASLLKNRRLSASPQRGRLIMGPPGNDLPGARRETLALADSWGLIQAGQPYSGEKMQVQTLREHARLLERIHLATHSCFDVDDYLRSHLVFFNERLSLFSLLSDETLDFHGAHLFYLSSCESGVVQADSGDELHGLVWTLLYAGAGSVMASMWPVHDDAAEYMANAFYHHWRPCTTLIDAHQQTLEQLRKEPHFSNPYFWAPFVLYGNGFVEPVVNV